MLSLWYYLTVMKFKDGLLLGLLVGIGSAMLCTPKSGKEVREEMQEKINSVPRNFFSLLESLIDLTVTLLDFAKEAFGEQSGKFSSAISKGMTSAREKTEELRKFASNASSK